MWDGQTPQQSMVQQTMVQQTMFHQIVLQVVTITNNNVVEQTIDVSLSENLIIRLIISDA